MPKGFTLIELVVVVAIIAFFSALILPNYRMGDSQLSLQRTAHKMAQDLRRTQELSISAKEFGGEVPYGYGIYFDINQARKYIVFADVDGDQTYSGLNEKVEEPSFEANVIIKELDPKAAGAYLTILFVPPNPTVIFFPDSETSTITLETETAEVFQQIIQVNKAGLISLE